MSEDTPGVDFIDDDQQPVRVSFVRHDTMDKNSTPPVALQLVGGSRPSETSEPNASLHSESSVKEFANGGACGSKDNTDQQLIHRVQAPVVAATASGSASWRDRQKFLQDDDDLADRWRSMRQVAAASHRSAASGIGDDDVHDERCHDRSHGDEDDDDEDNEEFFNMLPSSASGGNGPAIQTGGVSAVGGGGALMNLMFGDDDADPLMPFPRVSSSQILYKTKPPKIVGHYLIGDQLGEGSYGKVKEALDCDCLCRRAVKILKERRLRKILNGEQDVRREIRLLKRLIHRNVIRLFDVLRNEAKQKMYLFIEYCVGSVQEMLDSAPGKKLPIWQTHAYFVQLLDGLEYLHGQNVVHKDIKPGNLLLTTDETLKITDLGVAEDLDRYAENDICRFGRGTPKFQPPEIAGGQSQFHGFPVDIWSSGVTLYNMVSGLYPYEGENVYKLYDNITRKEVPMPPDIDAILTDLLNGMLCKIVQQRMPLQVVKGHVWSTKKHPRTLDRVPLPAYRGDPLRHMTVYAYLEQMYAPARSSTSSVAMATVVSSGGGESPPPPLGQRTVMSERSAAIGGKHDADSQQQQYRTPDSYFGGSEPDRLNRTHRSTTAAASSSSAAAASASSASGDAASRHRPFDRLQQSLVRKSSSEPRTNKLHSSGKSKPKVNFCKIQ